MGVPGFFGASLQGSAAAPFTDPIRDASMLMSFVQADRIRALGRAIGSAVDVWSQTGQHPISSSQVRDQFIKAVSPRSITRIAQVWNSEYIKSLTTTNDTVGPLTGAERLLFASGFNPTFVERNFRASREMWKKKSALRESVQTFGRLYFEAIDNKDWRGARIVLQQAMAQGVPIDSVVRSMMTRQRRSQGDIFTQFDPAEMHGFRNVIGRR